ncbi:permease [Aureibaculum sp. 2210JD6-5]|uniref:permease n=1 Tax=Aureibaculum sp. 2210JD6-5 TaxID=3103957 RepID=UPI002AACE49F|nr:permease [Aureibaculum sp. 2210JD6-5]MDY7396080.1 permease [Aureibaculum sp. 2210JD6-5]
METVKEIGIAFFGMSWELFWGLALGFMISALIGAFVSAETVGKSLGKTNPKSIGLSTFFGAISSSCSYAAASMSRTLLLKGASFPNAVAFLISSTNLVFEMFIIIFSLLGWAFFMGELIGGIFFILATALLIHRFFPKKIIQKAQAFMHKEKVMVHDHEGHMHHIGEENKMHSHHPDMPKRKGLKEQLKAASSHFVMDVNMVGKDILLGVLISSILMVVVPKDFWEALFLADSTSEYSSFLVLLWNAVIGSLIAIVSFVCSVGNIVLAAVLWYGGISFGGVIAFVLSDLITLPMLQVYRKYFGWKPMLYIFLFLFIGIIMTALFLDYSFDFLGWIPENPTTTLKLDKNPFELNYRTILNIIFIPLAILFYAMGKKRSKHMLHH